MKVYSQYSRRILGFIALIGFFSVFAANLSPGQLLQPGQELYSDGNKYKLAMQGDGNLVYYKTSDNSVRWNSGTQGNPGAYAAMQGDGNLVVYQQGIAKWNSQTQGNPGAFLAAQGDGNLVVYSAGGQALWHIGADQSDNDPKLVGDVIGRDLDVWGMGALGHIALFDGGALYEVLNEPGNAVKYNSVANFKSRSRYWGVASPNIPNYLVKLCADTSCNIAGDGGGWETVYSRFALTKRAYQTYIIGAAYTLGASYTRAEPSFYRSDSGTVIPSKQGLYRCDTFIVDTYGTIANVVNGSPKMDALVSDMKGGVMLPSNIFSKLKAAI